MGTHIRRFSEVVFAEGALAQDGAKSALAHAREHERLVSYAHGTNLAINVGLLVAKLGVFLTSGSMAVLASLLDSTVDLVAQGVLFAASHLARASPSAGRGQYGPLGVFTCAVLMALAAAQVVWAAFERLGAMAAGTAEPLRWTLTDSGLMIATVASRFLVAVGCTWVAQRTADVTVRALAQDSVNDVVSNTAALVAACATQLGPIFALTDPLGAIAISTYIIYNWAWTGLEQVELITGKEPDADVLALVSGAAARLSQEAEVARVRAHHVGPRCQVEVDLLMGDDVPLLRAHAVAQGVQRRVQRLDEVQRCAVRVWPRADAAALAGMALKQHADALAPGAHVGESGRDVEDAAPLGPPPAAKADEAARGAEKSVRSLPAAANQPRRSDSLGAHAPRGAASSARCSSCSAAAAARGICGEAGDVIIL
ncbi:hypothetical protein KFE25_003913 [Diacronema lutheri]|uniref:Cation efflux protein transmembrane domain-containing protein n=1 Tax=Diacronema lutheri TaxID=2081491 RepID=A0A8J6CBF0_DIALT|nr:hypothetical protein KFE25_003913 [Diacronema lutheri]